MKQRSLDSLSKALRMIKMLLNLPGMLKLTKLESIFITAALMDHSMNLKSNAALLSFTAHVRQLLLHSNFYYFFIILFFLPDISTGKEKNSQNHKKFLLS